ncbi:MAG: hypothetical protein HY695_36060 [Deltaproteobacteria bacterium]|nr:hypothetical protein [Deltaproteobacteria bacterium]
MVVIDEIQRLPELLNEVHRLIEDSRGYLPGSGHQGWLASSMTVAG